MLNREFDCSYPESFSDTDFERLSAFIFDENESRTKVLNVIDHVKLLFPNQMKHDEESFSIIDAPLSQVEKLLADSEIEFRRAGKSTIHTHGAIISHKEGDGVGTGVSVVLDPFCLKLNERLINDLVKILYSVKSLDKHWANIFFR